MFKYFQTTTLLLLLCLLMSIGSAYLTYHWSFGRLWLRKTSGIVHGGILMPVLLVAPVLLVVFYRLLGVNLIYPVSFTASFFDLAVAGIVPALVLAFASGLLISVTGGVKSELCYWRSKSFVTMMTAAGLPARKMLSRLVVTRSLVTAWMRCMPWLFGELIIVEVVFNAPGLGLDIWTMAKQRNLSGLVTSMAWLAALYVLCVALAQKIHGQLGKRLDSYT